MTLELEIDEHEEIPEEEIQLAGAPDSPLAEAARFLDQALHAGCSEPQVAYLLALAHKRLGRPAEARAALRKIPRPDANVLVQMGLLSLRENQPAQAEQEFARAWQMDAASFAACHNLLLSRLTLGKVKDCLAMLPKAIQLCPSREQKHLFSLLHELLRNYQEHSPAAGDMRPLLMLDPDSPLENLGDGDEQKLIALFRSLGQIDVTFNLLRTLAGARPNSAAVGAAYLEAAIIKARDLMTVSYTHLTLPDE